MNVLNDHACPSQNVAAAAALHGYPYDSRATLDYTYTLDRLSCVRQMYFIHVTFAYLVVFLGIACMLCRIHDAWHKWHALFGRMYILCMLWCMGTSLLIHNVGLPVGVLISFLFVLVGLSIGWACIVIFKLCNGKPYACKAAHGSFMFMTWVNMLGRLFASNQSGDFSCHTYPVYKQLDSSKFMGLHSNLSFVPILDPAFHKMPWAGSLVAWSLGISLGPLLLALALGALHSWWAKAGKAAPVQYEHFYYSLSLAPPSTLVIAAGMPKTCVDSPYVIGVYK